MSDWEKEHKMIKEAQLLCKVFFQRTYIAAPLTIKGHCLGLKRSFHICLYNETGK